MSSQTVLHKRVEQAEQAYQSLVNQFYDAESGLFLEHSRNSQEPRRLSFLWPYSGVLSAVNALARLQQTEGKYDGEIARRFAYLEDYWNETGPVPGYDSSPRQIGWEARFYDDNEWIGKELLAAYKQLGDDRYLTRARQVFAYVISGWSEQLGGGIYWKEGDLTTKNTCSNGPGAIFALQLYDIDRNQTELDWARRLLDWSKRLKDPKTGVYWDHVNSDGSIDTTTWTYNTGSILHANVLLHQLTGDIEALAQARDLATCSLSKFLTHTGEFSAFPAMPWFNVVLLRGYTALLEVDQSLGEHCISAFQSYLDGAWTVGPDQQGLFTGDWAHPEQAKPARWLLDQAAMVETAARLAVL